MMFSCQSSKVFLNCLEVIFDCVFTSEDYQLAYASIKQDKYIPGVCCTAFHNKNVWAANE